MRLKTQIFFGYLFILLLTLLLTGTMMYYLEGIGSASDKLLKDNYRSVKASEGLVVSLAKIDQLISKISFIENYNEKALLAVLEKEQQMFFSQLKVCKKEAASEEEISLVEDIENEYLRYVSLIEESMAEEAKPVSNLMKLQLSNTALREMCVNLTDLNHEELSKKHSAAQQMYFDARAYALILLLVVLFLGSIAAYNIPHRIVQPIVDLTDKIKRIAAGEYGLKLKTNASNELGNLINAFNSMSTKLKEFQDLNISKIQAQNSRMETIINSLNDGLIVLDESRNTILVNEKALMILDIEEQHLLGQSLNLMAEENAVLRDVLVSINKTENNLKEEAYNTNSFVKLVNPDGKNEFFTKDIVKVYDKSDDDERRFVGYVVNFKDVTLFKKSDEAKNNFISVVSHELKTPLSAMNMSLMLLQDDRFGSLNPEQLKIAASMKHEVQRLIKMVGELLDLSKVEAGNIDLQIETVQPGAIIEQALKQVDDQLKDKKIKLITDLESEVPTLKVDFVKVSWVLVNFLSNAIRFTAEGGTILIKVQYKDNYAEFIVEDEGPGLKPENINKLFNKFVQIPDVRAKDKSGFGLGLAISKEVIEEHGGEIGVISSLGIGSRFFFKLPYEIIPDERKSLV